MSSSRKSLSENWLLVEWNSGGRDVVYVKSVVSPLGKELNVGDALTVNRRGEREAATLIARARERNVLDAMVRREDVAGPSEEAKEEEEGEDFSSSASSWVPSDDGAQSGDSVEEKQPKKVKLERYKRQYSNRRSSKILTPSIKANAVLSMINRKRPRNDRPRDVLNLSMNKSVTDSTRRNQNSTQKVAIDVQELVNINNTFKLLFRMIEEWKQPESGVSSRNSNPIPVLNAVIQGNEETIDNSYSQLQLFLDDDKENENDMSGGEEFNRSDDNVLISNKYSNVGVRTVQLNETADREWIPIGSGQTLIHKDKFKKINWKSYTIATRTLLLAAFPKRILATHSLTGKRSPAFQNKPAKMCLDPKITSDVIMEIMDRFNVRENLVRSIITTKCADECKMLKMRNTKKKSIKNQENAAAGHSK